MNKHTEKVFSNTNVRRGNNYLRRGMRYMLNPRITPFVITMKNMIQMAKNGSLRLGIGIFHDYPDDFSHTFSKMIQEILQDPRNVTTLCEVLLCRNLLPLAFERFTIAKVGDPVEKDYRKWAELLLEKDRDPSFQLVMEFYPPLSDRSTLSMKIWFIFHCSTRRKK